MPPASTPSIPLISGSYDTLATGLANVVSSRAAGFGGIVRGIEIIVPSAAVTATLTERIAERFPRGVAGIVMRTPDQLAQEILFRSGASARVATDSERELAMEVALRKVAPRDPLFATSGMTALLNRSWRDISDGGVTLSALRRSARHYNHRDRFGELLAIYEQYEKLLAAIRSIDPSELFTRATRELKSIELDPQILFGFYDATAVQMDLIGAIGEAGLLSAIYAPYEITGGEPALSFAARFHSAIAEGTSSQTAAARDEAKVAIHAAATRGEETTQVCSSIASLLASGVRPSEIGIVKRAFDPVEVELFRQEASAFGFALNASRQSSLTSHRIGRGVARMLHLRDGRFSRADVVEVVGCGLRSSVVPIKTSAERLDEVSRKAEVVRGTAEEVKRLFDRSIVATWSSAADYVALLEHLDVLTRDIPLTASPARWSEEILRLANLFSADSEADIAAFEAIAVLSSSLARFGTEFTMKAADIIQQLHDTSYVSTAADRQGVWIGDVMRSRGRVFRHLFAVGIEDDNFPQRRTEDALMPDAIRPRFGVRVIGDGDDEEALLFSLLRPAASETVTFSFSSAERGGKIKRPSRFLVALASTLHPEDSGEIVKDFTTYVERKFPNENTAPSRDASRIEQLLQGGAHGSAAIARAVAQAGGVRSSSTFDGFLSSVAGLSDVIRERLSRISPTRLERYGECPQNFLFSSLLDVEELQAPELEVEMELRKKGKLHHDILERFYRSLSDRDIDEADTRPIPKLSPRVADLLDAEITRAYDEFDRVHPPVNATMRRIERDRARQLLRAFVVADLADLASQGLHPKHFEYRFGESRHGTPDAEAARLQIGELEMTIRGSIDRVDSNAAGTHVRIVDYKSGKAERQRKIVEKLERGHALQLALYALAWQELHGVAAENIIGAVKPLGVPVDRAAEYSFRFGENRAAVLEILQLFTSAILRGQFPAFPGESCRYCAMALSCRTKHDPEEKLTLRAYRHARDLIATLEKKQ